MRHLHTDVCLEVMSTLNGVRSMEKHSPLISCKKLEYVFFALIDTSFLTAFRAGGNF
jgi:hypothetical protein